MRTHDEIKVMIEEINKEMGEIDGQTPMPDDYTERRNFLDTKYNVLMWVLKEVDEIHMP